MFPEVSAAVVAAIVSDWTGIPAGRMVKDEASQITELPARLAQRVNGQRDALAQIGERIQTARAGLGDPRKPVGVFCWPGRPVLARLRPLWRWQRLSMAVSRT